MEPKQIIEIPFEVLPESRHWTVGKAYRVKVVLRQTGVSESGALFELVDANSMEPNDAGKRKYLTEGGYMKH